MLRDLDPGRVGTGGSNTNITIFSWANGALSIDVANIGVFAGVAAPMLP